MVQALTLLRASMLCLPLGSRPHFLSRKCPVRSTGNAASPPPATETALDRWRGGQEGTTGASLRPMPRLEGTLKLRLGACHRDSGLLGTGY